MEDYWDEKNLIKDRTQIVYSESGRYSLTIEYYKTGEGTWDFTKGTICSNGKQIAEVKRNYHSFWHCWIEGHPDGHDYLLCGHDYQGYTVVDLSESKVYNYLPEEAKQGFGFCWADVSAPTPTKLIVEGCYWACPYEIVEYDFSRPTELPLPELSRKQVEYDDD